MKKKSTKNTIKQTKPKSNKKRYVVVATDINRRGVFGGYLEEHDKKLSTVKLSDARMAVYWSAETKGFLGLASTGPQQGSRITPPVPSIELNGVTAVIDCTEAARLNWEAELWT